MEALIEANYLLPGTTDVAYTIILSNERAINLNFHLKSIELEDQIISLYNSTRLLSMNDTFIGLKNPQFKVSTYLNSQ